MTNLDSKIVQDTTLILTKYGHRYETKSGEVILAIRPDDLKSELRGMRWKNLSSLDADGFARLGFRVVEAQYGGLGRKTGRFCTVVAIKSEM